MFKYQFDSKSKRFKNLRFSSQLGKLVSLIVKNYFYNNYFLTSKACSLYVQDKIDEIINSNNFYLKHKSRIYSLVNKIIDRYKFTYRDNREFLGIEIY